MDYAPVIARRITGTAKFILLVRILLLTAPDALAEVSIAVPDGAARDNVLAHLSLAKEECTAPEWKIRSLVAKSDEEIDPALRALGYYHPTVKKSLDFPKDCWKAHFEIDLGPRVIVSDVVIDIKGEAHDDIDFIRLREELLVAGNPLHHGQYEKMKSRIESLALERGYLKSAFTESKLLVDPKNNTARIRLAFDSGKRFYFGAVKVQQDILNPEFMKKFISIKSGDFYDSEPLVKTYNDLSKSNYFDQISIRPDTESGELQVPVNVALTPKSRHHYAFGLGYDTDIGPLVSASYANRRLNRRGHFLTANLDLSPVLSTADVAYNVPLDDPTVDFFTLGAGVKNTETDTFEAKTAKISARLRHEPEGGWKRTLFLDFSYEEFTTGTVTQSTLLLVPGGNWRISFADDPLRPTRGYRMEFNTSGSIKNPISDVSFIQGAFSGVWMHPVPWDGRFIARTELGATGVDQFEELPATYRFYAGGMNSIRGYAYKELGPKDRFGNVVGGKYLGVVSAEYEKMVLDNWAVAAFVDTGNAFNEDSIMLKTGVGLGLRWYSPIGPIRIDFGVPLSEADSSFQVHFAAGSRL
jgi:translocation and assembly module TamA